MEALGLFFAEKIQILNFRMSENVFSLLEHRANSDFKTSGTNRYFFDSTIRKKYLKNEFRPKFQFS